MPLSNETNIPPRLVGKHPALGAPYGKTVDQITVAQRKLSPKFPSIAEAQERRRKLHEAVAARTLLAMLPLGVIVSVWNSFGWAMAGVGVAGFIVTCFVAGNRQCTRSGGGNRGRPF
jgi:hypothetical protein